MWTAGCSRTPFAGAPPFAEVQFAVNLVMSDPWSRGDAANTITSPGNCEPLGLIAGVPGLPGAPTIVVPLFADGAPVPTALRAATVNAYFFPFANPLTTALGLRGREGALPVAQPSPSRASRHNR